MGGLRIEQQLNNGGKDPFFLMSIVPYPLFAGFPSLLSYGCKMAAAAPVSYPHLTKKRIKKEQN